MPQPLLIPDFDALRRKWENPPAGMDELLARFQARLENDAEFRRPNLYLSALLGDPAAQEQAKAQILAAAEDYGSRPDNDYQFDVHTWCSAAPGMRHSVYFDWLDYHGLWTEAEREQVARGLLHFGYVHCVNTLRTRFPMSDNQSLSMSLYCAVTGYVFRTCPAVAERAQALHNFGMAQLEKRLGLAPPDGYMFEGSTYQSLVVAPLAMWTAAFLTGLWGPEAPRKPWPPVGTSLLDILRVESFLPSPGLLLPPWDHYGWQRQSNLAALAYYASLTDQPHLLDRAAEVWDRRSHIAWVSDDRMWALLFWPDRPLPRSKPAALSGWSLPQTAAAIDDRERQGRLMLAWDRCAFDRQGLARAQVNPNHVMYEIAGVPLFGDGIPEGQGFFLETTAEEIARPLSAEARERIAAQYGSVEKWAEAEQPGLIGAANTVIIDREAGYFPPGARRGQLVAEERGADLHVVTAESRDYYLPRYSLTRARRTIATSRSGLSWIVDDYRAAGEHTFTWQVYLRRGCTLGENSLVLRTSEGQVLSLAWLPVDEVRLAEVPAFPRRDEGVEGRCWPETGSQRLQLETRGSQARFVVCLLPGVAQGLSVAQVGEGEWRAQWPGGSETFRLPESADQAIEPPAYSPEGVCDLDDEPFDLPDEPSEALLAALENPDRDAWRRTVQAMQALTRRGVTAAMPLIQRLLLDPHQRYQVTSVAAWCLGHARYGPAREDLYRAAAAPETNTAFRARCALAALEGC